MNDLLDLLNSAVQSQNWVLVAAVAVLLLLSIAVVVLKALNKDVPILGTILDLGKGLVKFIPGKAPPPVPVGEADGIAKVVPIEDARKGPPEA